MVVEPRPACGLQLLCLAARDAREFLSSRRVGGFVGLGEGGIVKPWASKRLMFWN